MFITLAPGNKSGTLRHEVMTNDSKFKVEFIFLQKYGQNGHKMKKHKFITLTHGMTSGLKTSVYDQ